MAIYLTGDTHGPLEMNRFGRGNWPEGSKLTKDDYLIVLGDFGLIFLPNKTKQEEYWRRWLNASKWTTLFIDGNHDNHQRLSVLPKIEMFESTVGVVAPSIFYLRRGQVYTIAGKKFFVMGGASSLDKASRTEGITWWREEVPSCAEMEEGLENLEKHKHAVDYILSHTVPEETVEAIMGKYLLGTRIISRKTYPVDPTSKYLSHVCSSVTYTGLYAGHWHTDEDYGKHHVLYKKIVRLS